MIVFDFDGVIADSRQAVLRVLDAFAAGKGIAPLQESELRQMSTRQLLQRVKLRWYQLPRYVRLARRELERHLHFIKLQQDILPVLAWARKHEVPISIVSSNSVNLIESFLRAHVPEARFDILMGDAPLFGKHRGIKRLLRRRRLRADEVVYVGDEVRDMEAARRAGVRSIAVTWGKDNETLLSGASPTLLARSGVELAEAVARLHLGGAQPVEAS